MERLSLKGTGLVLPRLPFRVTQFITAHQQHLMDLDSLPEREGVTFPPFNLLQTLTQRFRFGDWGSGLGELLLL